MLGLIFNIILLPFRLYGILSSAAALAVGIAYPALESFKAVESKELGDDTQWLTYWVTVCTLMMGEKLLWPVLMWIPLYSIVRVAVVAWLALPQTQGAKLVYCFLRPFLFAAVDKTRQVPVLEPYLRSYQTAFSKANKEFAQLEKEAIAKVSETIEKAETELAASDAEPAYMKSHAQ